MRNKGNAKHGVSPRLKIKPCDLDLWPWKSIWFQIVLRSKYVPSLVKIHWRMLILECSQGCYAVKIWPLDLWLWKSIGFQTLLRTMYVPSLVKIHWRMLILECSQRCYMVKNLPSDLDLWPWKSIGFQILLRTKYVPSLVKIHWRMLILECSQGCDGRTESSVTISLRNFVGEGIITISWREQFTQSLVLCVCFVDRCLSFCPFSFSHCVVCPLIYGFWLLLWYLQTGLIFNEMMRSTLY